MYLSVRSVCASRMVSSDSLVSQARDVWIKPPLTIRDIRFFSDLGLGIVSRGRSSATMIVGGGSGGGGAGSGCGIGSGSVIGIGSGSESGNRSGSGGRGVGGGALGGRRHSAPRHFDDGDWRRRLGRLWAEAEKLTEEIQDHHGTS